MLRRKIVLHKTVFHISTLEDSIRHSLDLTRYRFRAAFVFKFLPKFLRNASWDGLKYTTRKIKGASEKLGHKQGSPPTRTTWVFVGGGSFMNASKVIQMFGKGLQLEFHVCAYVLYDKSHLSLQTFQPLVIVFQLFLLCSGGFLRDNLSLKSLVFYLPPVREAGSTQQILERKKLAVPPGNSESLLTPLPPAPRDFFFKLMKEWPQIEWIKGWGYKFKNQGNFLKKKIVYTLGGIRYTLLSPKYNKTKTWKSLSIYLWFSIDSQDLLSILKCLNKTLFFPSDLWLSILSHLIYIRLANSFESGKLKIKMGPPEGCHED